MQTMVSICLHRRIYVFTLSVMDGLLVWIVSGGTDNFSATSGKVNSPESVPDLEKAMYLTVEGYPCVRLLNLSGEIGCASKSYLMLPFSLHSS